MAIKHITSLKRNQICSILSEKNWDYKSPVHSHSVFEKCIQEVMTWHARRGKTIDPTIAQTIVERACVKFKLSMFDLPALSKAVDSFVRSPVQERLINVLLNFEIIVNTAKKRWLKYNIPYLNDTEERVDVILTNSEYKTITDLKASYEVKLASVWAFYARNRYPSIYNIYLENGKYKEVCFKTNRNYIKKSKIDINNMERLFYSYKYVAPPEVCNQCDRRKECPIHQTE
jgi:hypothetical protein